MSKPCGAGTADPKVPREEQKMRDEIRTLFPELEQIRDAALREKVIDVWVDSLETGGWTVEELKQRYEEEG